MKSRLATQHPYPKQIYFSIAGCVTVNAKAKLKAVSMTYEHLLQKSADLKINFFYQST